jgi:hypothetical protein
MATDAREHAGDGLPLVLEPGRKQQSDTIVEITKALVKFQMKVPPIPRNRTVTVRSPKGDYEFAYATLDVIMSAIRVPLAECGLVIVQTLTTDQPPILITKVLHESGDFIGSELVVSSGSSSGPQAMGSVISYMRRYAVAAVLALTTEDDDDANSAEGNSVQERKPGPRAATTASTTAPTQPTTKPSTDKQLGLVRNLVCEKLKVERGTDDATKENALRVANIFKPEHTIMALTFQQASALIDRLNKIGAAPAAAATATPAAKLEGDHSPEHLLHVAIIANNDRLATMPNGYEPLARSEDGMYYVCGIQELAALSRDPNDPVPLDELNLAQLGILDTYLRLAVQALTPKGPRRAAPQGAARS